MKIIKRLLLWAMISIIMQVLVLLYFDKIKFKNTGDIKIEKVQNYDKEEYKEIDYSELKDATKIDISDDGRYISYLQGEKFLIYDIDKNISKEIVTNEETMILYCSWIVDEAILVVVEKYYSENTVSFIRISTYNAKNNTYKVINDRLCEYIDGMQVSSIQSSIGAGTTYIGIKVNEYDSYIYKIDINDNSCRIGYYISDIGIMRAVEGYDLLIYEDVLNKQVYYYENGINGSVDISNINSPKLLGVDDEKNVYIVKLYDEKINSILYGAYNSDCTTWNTIELDKSIDYRDVVITRNNQLYIKENNKLKNIITNEELEYTGEFIQITSNIICSLYEDKLIIKQYR